KFRGIEMSTNVSGKTLDSPEFWPFYEMMEKYNLPIFLHPRFSSGKPYEAGGDKYQIDFTYGWPFETSAAMTCLVFGGVFEKHPNLKVITHHAGGMIPFFKKRIQVWFDFIEMRMGFKYEPPLTHPPLYYFRKFYNDTAIYGHKAGLVCAYDFCGADHLVFATDFPYDTQIGERLIRETIESVEEMGLTDAEKKMVFEDNAREILRLPI
ncbi:MAG: amidohydrolase family protein, partial [Pseudomonadota bacterium]